MTTANMQQVFDDYAQAWSSHDVEYILSFFTDDCVYEDVPLGVVNRGKDALRAFTSATFAAFPNFKIEPKVAFATDNEYAMEWIMLGTHQGDFPGLPATGKDFSIQGYRLARCRAERSSEPPTTGTWRHFCSRLASCPCPGRTVVSDGSGWSIISCTAW